MVPAALKVGLDLAGLGSSPTLSPMPVSVHTVRKTMFSPNLVSHSPRHVTFFRLPVSGGLVGTWWAGRGRAAGAIVCGRRGSKIASEKIYRALRTACFNAIFKDSRQHSGADR